MQIINKKCPYCVAIFKVKSALETHLQTKHPDKQPVSVDQIPDVKLNDNQHYQNDNVWSQVDNKLLINPSSNVSIYEMDINQSIGVPFQRMQSTHSDTNSVQYSQLNWLPYDFWTGENDEISYSADDSNTDQDDIIERNTDENIDIFGRNEKFSEWNDIYVEYTESFRNERKRHRTTLNMKQLHSLRSLFTACKTPNMLECELVGREIGLPRRVIQVGCLPIVNLFCCGKKSRYLLNTSTPNLDQLTHDTYYLTYIHITDRSYGTSYEFRMSNAIKRMKYTFEMNYFNAKLTSIYGPTTAKG